MTQNQKIKALFSIKKIEAFQQISKQLKVSYAEVVNAIEAEEFVIYESKINEK